MKKISLILLLFNLCGLNLLAQEIYTDELKDFSFVIPHNWRAVSSAALKYNLVVGEYRDNFYQNIVINSEISEQEPDAYISDSIQKIKDQFPNAIILKNEPFKNENEIVAQKLLIENQFENIGVIHYYYIFKNTADKVNEYFVCIASVLKNSPEEMEEIFDESFKTFTILPKE